MVQLFSLPQGWGPAWYLVVADDALKGPCEAVGFNIFLI
jgi:hypothetical protein